jgi:RDD family
LLLGLAAYTGFALWFLAQGKTPGKWLVKIRVADKSTGRYPGLGRMLVREIVGKMASGLFLGIGYFWAIWDPANQCGHDKIAGTLVVREGASPTSESTGSTAIAAGASLTILAPIAMAAPASVHDSDIAGLSSGTAVVGTGILLRLRIQCGPGRRLL